MSVKITAEFANYDAAEIAARAVRKHCSGVTRIVLRDNSVGRWSDEYHIGAYPLATSPATAGKPAWRWRLPTKAPAKWRAILSTAAGFM